MLCKPGMFPVLIAFLVIALSGAFLLRINRIDQEQKHYQKHTEMLAVSYQAALDSYQLATEIYLRDTIKRPDVMGIFARAWRAGADEKAELRRQLYQRLHGSYRLLWQNRLRQLHFHLPDGESFLRFHQPDRYGDKLFMVRPTVRIANVDRRPISGFEAGRIIDGFRFVVPLSYQGTHVGSVETSIPFRSLQDTMERFVSGREYQCLINTDLVHDRLFTDFSDNYIPSPLTPAYLLENPKRSHADRARPLSAEAQEVVQRLAEDHSIAERLAHGGGFSVGLIQKGAGYVVSFLPIREITGKLGGYIVCFAQDAMVVSLQRSYLIELAALGLLLASSFWLMLRWRCSVAQLAEQTAHQQYEEALQVQQEKVEYDERSRISRDLHDGIGQALLAVKLRLQLFLERMGTEQPEMRREVSELIADVQQASGELRNLVVSLRPLPLSGMQVDEAVQWLCRNLERSAGVALLVQTNGSFQELSDQCSLTLFRVCQEGLANILKHAAAKRVQVSLQRQNNLVVLTIQDDGGGGAVSGKAGGSGLVIMRERIEQAGGRLTIDSPEGGGTRILVELPC